MNQEQYNVYKEKVSAFLEREKVIALSQVEYTDAYFSWNECDCCGSKLGGDRYDMAGYCTETKQVNNYAVCCDCVYYLEYGQLDDMTMMDNNLE